VYLEFHGAADEVTGSLHRLHVGELDIGLDCGLFQGHRAEANRLNREIPTWAIGAQAIVLSHAHLDHSGNLPTLVRRGFRGNIVCTPATRDLCSVMLRDAAMIQDQDARYINRHNQRNGSDERVEPLYDAEDAERAVSQMISVPLHRAMPIGPSVSLTFHDSGHVLGSALCAFDVTENGQTKRILFTGDLGRAELPLLRSPEVVPGANILLMESTYGDRDHPNIGRRALPYLFLFQVLLPLLAPLIDLWTIYGLVFLDPVPVLAAWLAFNLVQVAIAAYAFRLDHERLRPLWSMPLQQLFYRQLMYLVVIQSAATAIIGVRLPWQRIERTGAINPDAEADTRPPTDGPDGPDEPSGPDGPVGPQDPAADLVIDLDAPAEPVGAEPAMAEAVSSGSGRPG